MRWGGEGGGGRGPSANPLSQKFSHPLFLSRLEFLKAVFCTLFFFWFSSMISPTLWKILVISLLMTPPSAVPSVIPQTGKPQLLHAL